MRSAPARGLEKHGARFAAAARCVALLALLCAACAREEPRARNLVLISLDTVRADRLGCYGYERPTTPSLDRFAQGGTLFEEAYATSPWTKPSHASLFTGLYPHRNGVLGFEYALSPDVVHIAELLSERGFQTGAVVSNSVLTLHGLERGFQHFEFVERGKGPEPSAVSARALEWLGRRDRSRPFFAFVHFNDAHADYRALPEYTAQFVRPYEGVANGKARQLFAHALGLVQLSAEDARHLSDLYDAALRQLDDQVATLLDYLEREGLLADTLVVLVSDHGEEFLEHGGLQHGLTQYDESVRIPLVLRGPGIAAGARSSAPVSLVDVLPTCLAELGIAIPSGLDGVSVLGAVPERALYFEADCALPDLERTAVLAPGSNRAIRWRNFKLHHALDTQETRLHDLAEDPGERRDVRAENEPLARELLADLLRFLGTDARAGERSALSEEQLARLRELGYAGGD